MRRPRPDLLGALTRIAAADRARRSAAVIDEIEMLLAGHDGPFWGAALLDALLYDADEASRRSAFVDAGEEAFFYRWARRHAKAAK